MDLSLLPNIILRFTQYSTNIFHHSRLSPPDFQCLFTCLSVQNVIYVTCQFIQHFNFPFFSIWCNQRTLVQENDWCHETVKLWLSGSSIGSFLVHSDTEYRPIEFPVSHPLQNWDQSMAFRATTTFTIGWRPVHNFLLMILLFSYSAGQSITEKFEPAFDRDPIPPRIDRFLTVTFFNLFL